MESAESIRDHDLLIQIDTKLGRVIDDVKELKDNVSERVDHLEDEKVDKVEAERLTKESAKIHEDHEKRIRFVEQVQSNFKGKYAIVGGLSVLVLSGLISWAVSHYLK